MIVSITRIELNSYSKLFAYLRFNRQIFDELKLSNCKKYKMTGSWNLKVWYTMTLWENKHEINDFYRTGKHLQVMKQAKTFSSKISSTQIEKEDLMSWSDGKKMFSEN